MNNIKMKKFAPVVLRLGLVMVFIWFGCNQLLNPDAWVSLIPDWATSLSGMGAGTVVMLNGIFEICMAVLLAFGICIRIVATLLFLHLGMIIGELGLSAIGVRDVGLAFATLSVALHGSDEYSFDKPHEIIS